MEGRGCTKVMLVIFMACWMVSPEYETEKALWSGGKQGAAAETRRRKKQEKERAPVRRTRKKWWRAKKSLGV